MAANLRAKILKDDTLLINDRSQEAMDGLVKEITAASGEGAAKAMASPREVAERSVCLLSSLVAPFLPDEIHNIPNTSVLMI